MSDDFLFCHIHVVSYKPGDRENALKKEVIFGTPIRGCPPLNGNYPVIKPVPYRDRYNKISELIEDPKGRVCLWDQPKVSDIDAMAQLVCEGNGVALLVVNKPSEPFDVPIFVVSKGEMTRIAKLNNARASFELMGVSPSEWKSPNKVASAARELSSMAWNGDQGVQTKANKDVAASKVASKSGDSDRKVPPTSATKQSYFGEAFVSAIVSGVGAAIDAGKELIDQNSAKNKIYCGLRNLPGWTESKQFGNCEQSTKLWDECAKSNDTKGICTIIREVAQFLHARSGNLLHLTFAAHICNTTHTDEVIKLKVAVLERVKQLDPSSFSLDDLSIISLRTMKPRSIWDTFFVSVMGDPGRWDASFAMSDQLLLNMFWMWSKCGLFAERRSLLQTWRAIGKQAHPEFVLRCQERLLGLLGKERVRSLSLLVRPDLSSVSDMIFRLEESEAELPLYLEPFMAEFLKVLVTDSVSTEMHQTQVLSSIWSISMASLGKISFGKWTRETCPHRMKIIKAMIYSVSYETCTTYTFLAELFENISADHPDYHVVYGLLQQNVLKDLQMSRPRTSDVVELLSSPPGTLLSLNTCTAALKEFTVRKMRLKIPFETKLCFLGSLFEKFVTLEWCDDSNEFHRFIVECVRIGTQADGDFHAILRACFAVTDDNPCIFDSKSEDTTLMDDISNICVRAELCRRILLKAALLNGFRLTEGRHATFHNHLTLRLRLMLTNECDDVFVASRFCCGAVDIAAVNCRQILSIAVEIFESEYLKWSPKSLTTLALCDHDCLNQVVTCLDLIVRHSSVTDGDRDRMIDCTNHLRGIINDWLQQYQLDLLASADLLQAIQFSDSENWCTMSTILGRDLPRKKELYSKSEEFDELRESMKKLLFGDSGLSIQRIFKGYGCVSEDATIVGKLLREYAWLHPSAAPSDAAISHPGVVSKGGTLQQMRQDCEVGLAFRRDNDDALLMCEYFLTTPSALFRDALSTMRGATATLDCLLRAIQRVKDVLATLFSSRSDFKSVSDAVKSIYACDSTIDREVKVLLDCQQLNIAQHDAECFRIVGLLSEVCDPLKCFVESCRQFKFELVKRDTAFESLASINFFDTSESECSREVSLKIFKQLCGLLLAEDIPADQRLEDHVEKIRAHLPVFELFGCLSRSSEVWIFTREMGWFGDSGLKRFYEEYENVTNVLLGYTASFEMSVLDAMEPTMRMVSAIGALSLSSDISMIGLLKEIQRNKDICHFMECDRGRDISQVQTNISQLREWFSVGVDEIAAVHGVFHMACRTGTYCIGSHQPRIENTLGKDFAPNLTLTYTSRRDHSGNDCALEGENLDVFVQQLGMIQHETRSASTAIAEFVEQYHLLLRASKNFSIMQSIGFHEPMLSSIVCRVGGEYSAEARTILLNSRMALSNCDAWLEKTRSMYPSSLLFWVAELRELHHLLLQSAGESIETNLNGIACIVSRLLSSRQNALTYEERMSIIHESCTPLVKEIVESSESWLVQVSMFLDLLHRSFGTHRMQSTVDIGVSVASDLFVHNLSCSDDLTVQAIFHVLQHIYEAELPRDFEVLDGQLPCTEEKISVFLNRVRAFPVSKFVVFNVEAFDGKIVEALLSFLSDRANESNGIRLHFIQREGSMLHSSPWVRGRTWDNDCFPELEIDSGGQDIQPWKELILDQIHISEVCVLCGDSCGAGKTRHIREELSRLLASRPEAEVGTVLVHEGSTIASLTKALSTKFRNAAGTRAVHFNFSCIPELRDETKEWLQSINQFFFSLLVLRCVHSSASSQSFHLGPGEWKIFVELPSRDSQGGASEKAAHWLRRHIPALSLCATIVMPSVDLLIDERTRRVCTYLRAYDDGSINRKFEAKRPKGVIFVLDKSGSMQLDVGNGLSALEVATDNALQLFDNHVDIGDMFGITMFDSCVYTRLPLQVVANEIHKAEMRVTLDDVRHDADCGTNMYSALNSVLRSIGDLANTREMWIVCLTDGDSSDSDVLVRRDLEVSSVNLHLVIIGVNLHSSLDKQMRHLCTKYRHDEGRYNKGFYVRAEGDFNAIELAFDIVSQQIPVSKSFALDGDVTDADCRRLMHKYLPVSVRRDNMHLQSFWIQFLYRRVKIFDENASFNYNETHDALGSSLMEAMLSEVDRFLCLDQGRDWIGSNHTQLIYDFTNKDAPEFRLICTAPDAMDENLRRKLESLQLPGFHIPTEQQLRRRSTLDLFLSQALGVPLEQCGGVDRTLKLKCIDDHKFVLTLDFTMKLLSIHERVVCRLPCVIEGETGVSKTALTKMYAILRNSSSRIEAELSTARHIDELVQALVLAGHYVEQGPSAIERLQRALASEAESVMGIETDITRLLDGLITEKCRLRSCLFQDVPNDLCKDSHGTTTPVTSLLNWFSKSVLEETFFEINVDSSLTEIDIVRCFDPIRKVARKLLDSGALVVVFLDEINTSSVMGLFNELVVDCSLAGEALESNIVLIAACNPARGKPRTSRKNPRELDLGKDWASGHYQVAKLPPSIDKLKWAFGSLNRDQEKEFIYRRLEGLGVGMAPHVQRAMTELLSECQESIRQFAIRNLKARLAAENKGGVGNDIDRDAMLRARSVVSLRDIQRVFDFFSFFLSDFRFCQNNQLSPEKIQRRAMILAISAVYFLRLDSQSRLEFNEMMKVSSIGLESEDIQVVLDIVMDKVISETLVPEGIAVTRGLKENAFMTLVCALSQTPLLIVGPPGSSKTLSVNIVSDNANGEDSPNPLYRAHARLSVLHYQCSKQSTSKEIAAVFDKAVQRQCHLDPSKHRYVVFMDEAGLPEEEKESLKVLHYLLEGHMSAKAKVGFVAITNHVLDAAKSNRCVTLLREQPDHEELLSISHGVLFDARQLRNPELHRMDFDGKVIGVTEFVLGLCRAYSGLINNGETLSWFECMFGLRDYIHFLKAIRRRSSVQSDQLSLTLGDFVYAVERNFNGVQAEELREIAAYFLKQFTPSRSSWRSDVLESAFRDPVHVIGEALSPIVGNPGLSTRSRFKLIIDCTEDDSILRLLKLGGMIDVSKRTLFKVSHMPEETSLERLRLISGVKFAALQGRLAVLSQTESVNESFYDLFNQHFRSVTGRDGAVALYANISVGGISRRSLVRPDFECIIHVRESNMHDMPAPFLNRFEKFRLSVNDILVSRLSAVGGMAAIFQKARCRVGTIASQFGERSLFGWVDDGQTLDSIFVGMILRRSLESRLTEDAPSPVAQCIFEFVTRVADVELSILDVESIMDEAIRYLPPQDASIVQTLRNNAIDSSVMQNCLNSILLSQSKSHALSKVCTILLQMILTRVAMSKVIQLARPESLFCRRNDLPDDLVREYFNQPHFSLRSLITQISLRCQESGRTKLMVVYCRSETSIHNIPNHGMTDEKAGSDHDTCEQLRSLVYENADELIVAHLSMLKCEAALRGATQFWVQHRQRNIFLLLVDMSENHSLDRTNFVRMCVEQNVTHVGSKVFVLLLHYSPSSSHRASCYPALFLGGWDHFFLDGVGTKGASIGVEKLIQGSCLSSTDMGSDSSVASICAVAKRLLPRVLPHVASKNLFYPKQESWAKTSYLDRTQKLTLLLETAIGGSTISDIICSKFAKIWSEHAMVRTMQRASEALILGTTQLPLVMSVHSVLIEMFDTFLTVTLIEMNQWRNLDMLLCDHRNSKDDELFAIILRGLSIAPFKELILQKTSIHHWNLLPLTMSRHEVCHVRFPFFHLISSFLDETIDFVERQCIGKAPLNESDILCHRRMLLFEEAEKLLDSAKNSNSSDSGPMSIVSETIRFVQNATRAGDRALFEQYLHQYIEWKVGCNASPMILDWMRRKASFYNPAGGNIVVVHVIARKDNVELANLGSITFMVDRFPLASRTQDNGNDVTTFPQAMTGEDMFLQLLVYFEQQAQSENVPRYQWNESFFIFLQHVNAMLTGMTVDNMRTACRLRSLCFLYILTKATDTMLSCHNKAVNLWCSYNQEATLESLALDNFMILAKMSSEISSWSLEKSMLSFFFSPLWMKITHMFKEQDLGFLMDYIAQGNLKGPFRHFGVTLLRGACMDRSPVAAHKSSQKVYGAFGLKPLSTLSLRLSCEQLSIFTHEGNRLCMPHYIPNWLSQIDSQDKEALMHPFFRDYYHCFGDDLATAAFDMVVEGLLRQAVDLQSEKLLLLLLDDIDRETSLTRKEQARLSRLRQLSTEESLAGSPLGALVTDARVLCFVAKVAYEVAVESKATALSGSWGEQGVAIMDQIMSIGTVRWQEFFVSVIVRVRGEGTLASALSEGGALHGYAWCKRWCDGLPSARSDSVQALKQAEDAWAEANAEEDRKIRDYRLCPHCGAEFIVEAANCGRFICGRDAHLNAGAPQVGGVAVIGGYGCNQPFTLTQAGAYVADESILNPLRDEIAEQRLRLQQCTSAKDLWDNALSMQVPTLLFKLESNLACDSIVPVSSILSDTQDVSHASREAVVNLVRILHDGTRRTTEFSLLPTLIEFYLWVHTTFRNLLTKETAFHMKMSDIMNEERLRDRFGALRASHIMSVWRKVAYGVCAYLIASDGKVNWLCEEIEVGFKSLDDAPVISLLSEGDNPSDGNDVLFIIIHHIVGNFNDYVRKLNEGNSEEMEIDTSLDPRFIATGWGGGSAIDVVTPLSEIDLITVVESCWNTEEAGYDFERLQLTLREYCFCVRPTMIINPLVSLREKFSFRDDMSIPGVHSNVNAAVMMSKDGQYFANSQDLRLFDEVWQSLDVLEAAEGDSGIRRTLCETFHFFDYDDIRSMLEGCRSILALFPIDSTTRTESETTCMALNVPVNSTTNDKREIVHRYGFPELSDAQIDLILSLRNGQFVELVRFLGYQLASEGYLFTNLSLCMTDPLNGVLMNSIKQKLQDRCMNHGLDRTVDDLDVFVRDVLSFYELPIRDGAMSSNEKMKAFLSLNNFCDNSDPIFAILPTQITLRNYVSLRQVLHQVKLSLLFDKSRTEMATTKANNDPKGASNQPRRGQFWLLEADDCSKQQASGEDHISRSARERERWDLWFELPLNDEHSCHGEPIPDDDTAQYSPHDHDDENLAAVPNDSMTFDLEEFFDAVDVDV